MTATQKEIIPDSLGAEGLLAHVKFLAEEIGPRPAGQPAEARARDYIRKSLTEVGITQFEEMEFEATNSWGHGLLAPLLLALAGNALGKADRTGRLLSSATSLVGTYALWEAMSLKRQPFAPLYPKGQSGNILVRIPSVNESKRRLVLVANVDTGKNRLSFAPMVKGSLSGLATAALLALLGNGLVQFIRTFGSKKTLEGVYQATLWGILASVALAVLDERGKLVEGANGNASGVACLLNLAAQLRQQPLQHTEVWLLFTGAKEPGALGMHDFLDTYAKQLTEAWFIRLESVGSGSLVYATQQNGPSALHSYEPDPHSLALANKVALRNPEFRVTGRHVPIFEETAELRRRDLRGLCLVGVGEDGWPKDWQRYSDEVHNIQPEALERAARFTWALMQSLDEG